MQTPASGRAYLEIRKEERTLSAECSRKTQEKAGQPSRSPCKRQGVRKAPRRQEMWQRLRKQATPRLGRQMRERFQARSLTMGKKLQKQQVPRIWYLREVRIKSSLVKELLSVPGSPQSGGRTCLREVAVVPPRGRRLEIKVCAQKSHTNSAFPWGGVQESECLLLHVTPMGHRLAHLKRKAHSFLCLAPLPNHQIVKTIRRGVRDAAGCVPRNHVMNTILYGTNTQSDDTHP